MNTASFKEILPLRSLQGNPPPPRSARLPEFLGMRDSAAAALNDLEIAVIGNGSVGGEIALHWSKQQIKSIYLADPAHTKAESLLTHGFLQAENVAKAKASLVGHLCGKNSPKTRVFAFEGQAQSLPETALAGVHQMYLATDNLPTEVHVGQWCMHWGIPLIQAAVDGATLIAQVRVFTNTTGDGPCPRCCFGAAEKAALDRQIIFSCTGTLNGDPRGRIAAVPTMSPSFLCAFVANMAVMVGFRHVLGLGAPLADSLIEYCGYTQRTVISPLLRDPNCPCDHRVWQQMAPPRPALADSTMRELAAAAGVSADEPVSFTVGDDLSFVEWAVCRCGQREEVQRFCRAGHTTAVGDCASCGGPLHAEQFYSHRSVALEVVRALLDLPLRAIGAADAQWILVQGNDQPVVVRGTPYKEAVRSNA